MGVGAALLSILAGIFGLASIHHLMIWARNRIAREHLWFGLASVAATGAMATSLAIDEEASRFSIVAAPDVSASLSWAWLIATTWFSLEYAGGDPKRRRLAIALTLTFAFVLIGNLLLPLIEHPLHGVDLQHALRLLGYIAIAILVGMVIEAFFRLRNSLQHTRAATLGIGIGIALVTFLLQGLVTDLGLASLPPPAPYAFLFAVILITYELANTVAEIRVVSQRQRQELVHASRLAVVGELTASIAHEINQPLGAILSNADAGEILLEDPSPPLDEIRQILADIRRDGLRASDVIRHVRTLVRKRELVLEKLDANVVVTEVIALLEPEARRRRIPLANALLQQPAYLRGDRAHLEQVLINLMLNAMDAVEAASAADNITAARPPIVVGVSYTNHGEVEFGVVDAGHGLPAERLSHLFDSFYTSKPHGMGLGLSIARSIVEAHGGRIRAENNRDAGSTFRVALPPYDGVDG